MSTLISLPFPLLLYIRAALLALFTKLLEAKKSIIFLDSTFVVSRASSLLSFMMMLMKWIFDAYVPFGEKFIFELITRVRTHDSTVLTLCCKDIEVFITVH